MLLHTCTMNFMFTLMKIFALLSYNFSVLEAEFGNFRGLCISDVMPDYSIASMKLSRDTCISLNELRSNDFVASCYPGNFVEAFGKKAISFPAYIMQFPFTRPISHLNLEEHLKAQKKFVAENTADLLETARIATYFEIVLKTDSHLSSSEEISHDRLISCNTLDCGATGQCVEKDGHSMCICTSYDDDKYQKLFWILTVVVAIGVFWLTFSRQKKKQTVSLSEGPESKSPLPSSSKAEETKSPTNPTAVV
ncbi:Quinolinate synthase [Trichinella spiralis]|uniref:Quinolinate synthase n=1 Tax=Trichinella spiralis TaxID=6334 RepID=A0ABR3KQB9_TRISP